VRIRPMPAGLSFPGPGPIGLGRDRFGADLKRLGKAKRARKANPGPHDRKAGPRTPKP
jgi:hypothetical protein